MIFKEVSIWFLPNSVLYKLLESGSDSSQTEVCLVGTLNLCLKEPEKVHKTRNQSDHPRQRKRPKTGKNLPNFNFAILWQFFFSFLSQEWSDSSLVFCIFSGFLRHKFRVPTRHTLKNFKRHFGNASSVNFEFLFFSGVYIPTCYFWTFLLKFSHKFI